MDDLPLELKQRICSYLTPRDLKSVRLLSKACSVAACRYILPRVFLFNHQDSCQEIMDIAKHPLLSPRITTLVIDTSRFKSYPQFDRWVTQYKPRGAYAPDWADFEPPQASSAKEDPRAARALRRAKASYKNAVEKAPCTAQELKEQWKCYQYVAAAQAQVSSKTRMLSCLAVAFKSFPRLDNLVITYGDRDDFDTGGKRARMFHDMLLGLQPRRSRWYYDLHSGLTPVGFSFWELLQPAHVVNRALSSLTIIDVQFAPSEPSIPQTNIFRNLKHLRHRVDFIGDRSFLIPVINSAPNLQSIGLVDGLDANPRGCLLQVLERTSLKRCSFDFVRTEEEKLVRLLLQQAKSLQHLRFGPRCFLSNRGNFASMFARLRGRFQRLTRVDIGGLIKPHSWVPVEYFQVDDILELHEHELRADGMDVEDGLWEDYESIFFPSVHRQ